MGLSDDEIDKRVRDAAALSGSRRHSWKKVPSSSRRGQKRRAAIAGVIAMDPEVLILDEPTAGLDPMGRELLLSQIINYHKEKGNTVLLVSHSMEDIARVADRVLVMNRSKLFMLDRTREVFAHGDELEKIGLRVPQVTKIMQALREQGIDLPDSVLTVDEAFDTLSSLLKREGKIW